MPEFFINGQPVHAEPGQTVLQAALTDYHVVAIDETTSERWRVFFNAVTDRDQAIALEEVAQLLERRR